MKIDAVLQRRAFGAVRILFGLIWLINTLLEINPAYASHFLAAFNVDWAAGQPAWLAQYGHWMAGLVQSVGAVHVAWATVALNGLLAATLLTGIGFPFMSWVGFIYNLWLWSTVGGLGGPYVQGSTDAGTAIIYALCFLFVIWTRSWEGLSLNRAKPVPLSKIQINAGRILFGLLWAFDAFWKWQPYFLIHNVTLIKVALPGEPYWITAYISFFIAAIQLTGPVIFGISAAITESLIAISLLFGIGLRWMVPIGIIYSLNVWTTVEGWGGPYLPGITACRGDVLGTTNIYVIAFLFLAVWIYLSPRSSRTSVKSF